MNTTLKLPSFLVLFLTAIGWSCGTSGNDCKTEWEIHVKADRDTVALFPFCPQWQHPSTFVRLRIKGSADDTVRVSLCALKAVSENDCWDDTMVVGARIDTITAWMDWYVGGIQMRVRHGKARKGDLFIQAELPADMRLSNK